MKKIDIIIPTRNRWTKLLRCLITIPDAVMDIKINVGIVCDADPGTARELRELNDKRIDPIILVQKHRGSVYCRNLLTQKAEDAVLYATDDIEFKPGSIEAAVKAMIEHYPDEDGIVGFRQVNHKHFSKAGVALIGQKFLQRYPQKKLFCPEYFHFSCQEIERLGNKLGKIHLEQKAELIHYHPSFNHHEVDQTHREARIYRKRDRKISSMRREKDLIWGDK